MSDPLLSRRQFLRACAGAPFFLTALPLRPARATATTVGFDDLYERETVLTAKVQSLNGHDVEMVGYMAPPLKAEAAFFVLTRSPMAVCPFCETEMQWPDDIVLVLTDEPITAIPYNIRIRVSGRLDLGFEKDDATGFVSLIRLKAANFERV